MIEKVTHHPVRDGERIIIRDRVYEAIFKEGEVILRPRDKSPGAEDVVIPVAGIPEIEGNKVVYEFWNGQRVIFEGKYTGLRFREINPAHQPGQMGEHSGNIAELKERYTDGERSGEFLIDTSVVYVDAPDYQDYPAIAFDGTNYLVVWTDDRGGLYEEYDIYGARVTTSGTVLDPSGIPISTVANDQYNPSTAFDGTNYLVAWTDYRSGAEMYGARVTPSGDVLDTSGIPISTAPYYQKYPSIAFDGTNYLVVWKDSRSGSDYDIYGARVTTSGTVLDTSGIPISTAGNDQEYPSIAFDGTNYLVVWQDERNGPADIYGAKVSTSGTVLDTFPVSTQSGDQLSPAIAKGSGNQVLVVYSGWTDSINGHPANTVRIWGKFLQFTGIEEKHNPDLMKVSIYPNPFTTFTTIRYSISTRGGVSVKIYDVSGRVVKTLVNGEQGQGHYTIRWDGTDNKGKRLSSGIYFIKFNADKLNQTKKVILMK